MWYVPFEEHDGLQMEVVGGKGDKGGKGGDKGKAGDKGKRGDKGDDLNNVVREMIPGGWSSKHQHNDQMHHFFRRAIWCAMSSSGAGSSADRLVESSTSSLCRAAEKRALPDSDSDDPAPYPCPMSRSST